MYTCTIQCTVLWTDVAMLTIPLQDVIIANTKHEKNYDYDYNLVRLFKKMNTVILNLLEVYRNIYHDI